MSRQLGIPIVNYGLHASLGLDVIADRALQCVKPGDIVVLSPELSHFRKNGTSDFSDDLRIDFLAEHPSPIDPQLQRFPLREWRRARSQCDRIKWMIQNTRNTLQRFLGIRFSPKQFGEPDGPERTPYTLDAVGPDGSIVFPRPGPKAYDKWTLSYPPTKLSEIDLDDSRGGAAFRQIEQVCKDRHCLFCVMPAIRVTVPQFDKVGMMQIDVAFMDYAVKNGAIPLLQPGENVLPREDGFDTDYHLNEIGLKIMEPRLVAALKRVIPMAAVELADHP